MNLNNWKSSYHAIKTEAGISRFTLALCAIALVLLSVKAVNQETVVVVQPWTMNTKGWIKEDGASQSYKEAWGLAVSQLLGNVTPGNLDFIGERLGPLLPIDKYQDVMTTLKAQSIQLKENRITTRFEPTKVLYEKSTEKVFIEGRYFSKAPGIREKRSKRTYEFLITMDSYLPQIVDMNTYEDEPRTEKRLAQLAKQEKARKSKEQK